MHNTRLFLGALLLMGIALVTSCKKEEDLSGNVQLVLDHEFDNQPFRADTTTLYEFSDGMQASFSSLRYYFTNIRLQNDKGEWWAEEDSYHIIDATKDKPSIMLTVPEGKYTSIAYTVGVDSVKNFSGAQAGALSPSNGMFWSWQTGYIFMIVEGQCPQIDRSNKFFIHHVGGFVAPNNAVRNGTAEFPVPLVTGDNPAQKITLGVNVRQLYDRQENRIRIPEVTGIHTPGTNAVRVADNFTAMFRVKDVQN
jgi:hypothetical protein